MPGDLGSLNPTWSLAQEEQFYLVWPLVLLLLLRRRVRPQLVAALLLIAIGLLIAAAPIGARDRYSVYYSPAARAAELLFGCLGAVIWRHRLMRVPRRSGRAAGRACAQLLGQRRLWRALWRAVLAYLFVTLLFNYQLTTEQVYLRACLLAVPLIVNLVGTPEACSRARSPARRSASSAASATRSTSSICCAQRRLPLLPHGSIYLNALLTISLSVALAAASWQVGRVARARPTVAAETSARAAACRAQPWLRPAPVTYLRLGATRSCSCSSALRGRARRR